MRYLSFIFPGRTPEPSSNATTDDTQLINDTKSVYLRPRPVPSRGTTEIVSRALSQPTTYTADKKSRGDPEMADASVDERTPLLSEKESEDTNFSTSNSDSSFLRRWGGAINGTFQVIISTILAPGRWLIACFYDDHGRFSAFMPIYKISSFLSRRQKKKKKKGLTAPMKSQSENEKNGSHRVRSGKGDSHRSATSSSAIITDSETDNERSVQVAREDDSPARHTRSKSIQRTVSNDTASSRSNPSIRIKVLDNNGRQSVKRQDNDERGTANSQQLTVSSIKSPTSPTSSLRLTKYPRAPAPPRPLVPRRQPSYTTNPTTSFKPNQKTLIIDLDETLIHSMAKGGRMSTGHMVEVKLQTPVGAGGAIIGPQVPILYYVHKRPHCDDFLRKVSKWYNLIVFTASVQEYADPVIDWLELERKYFSARYYRQHCTYRNGAYIKDLGQVEPDLSKVMILDNSPMSYIFHEDNAIPIEGWISDPTDNDLLHLIPFFEALQHTTDVRSLLALRLGEASQ